MRGCTDGSWMAPVEVQYQKHVQKVRNVRITRGNRINITKPRKQAYKRKTGCYRPSIILFQSEERKSVFHDTNLLLMSSLTSYQTKFGLVQT